MKNTITEMYCSQGGLTPRGVIYLRMRFLKHVHQLSWLSPEKYALAVNLLRLTAGTRCPCHKAASDVSLHCFPASNTTESLKHFFLMRELAVCCPLAGEWQARRLLHSRGSCPAARQRDPGGAERFCARRMAARSVGLVYRAEWGCLWQHDDSSFTGQEVLLFSEMLKTCRYDRNLSSVYTRFHHRYVLVLHCNTPEQAEKHSLLS